MLSKTVGMRYGVIRLPSVENKVKEKGINRKRTSREVLFC